MGNVKTVVNDEFHYKFTKSKQLHDLTPWSVKILNNKGKLLSELSYFKKYDDCYTCALMFTSGYRLGYKQALIAK